jgi:flagellar basal body-associated protein FliL
MTGVRPQSLTGYKEKKKNKNLKTIIILLIVVAVIFAAGALIVTLTGSYSLPGWILERMTYGRASVGYMLLPDAPHLFFRAG